MNRNKLLIKSITLFSLSAVSLGGMTQIVSAIKTQPIPLPNGLPNVTLKSGSSLKNQVSPLQRTSPGRTPIKEPSPTHSDGLQRGGVTRTPVRFPDSSRKVLPKIDKNRNRRPGFRTGNID